MEKENIETIAKIANSTPERTKKILEYYFKNLQRKFTNGTAPYIGVPYFGNIYPLLYRVKDTIKQAYISKMRGDFEREQRLLKLTKNILQNGRDFSGQQIDNKRRISILNKVQTQWGQSVARYGAENFGIKSTDQSD